MSAEAGDDDADQPRRTTARSPTEVDSAVGQRIRERRIALGLPLHELSRRVGVTAPQMHRYESGATRVAASRLIAIAAVLGVPVQALTGAMPEDSSAPSPDTERLLDAFRAIDSPAQRRALIELARSMAGDGAVAAGPPPPRWPKDAPRGGG